MDLNFPTPNVELSINLSQYTSYSNTLVVELAPQWMIVNESNLDLIICHCNSSEFWSFSSSKAFVPPMMVCISLVPMKFNLTWFYFTAIDEMSGDVSILC